MIVTLSIDGVTSEQTKVDNGAFKFIGVLPATYTVSISDGGKCWEEPVKKISVSKDVKDVFFKQIGFYVTVESSRSTLMTIHGVKSKQSQEVVISKGNNVICVKGQDKDVTLATQGCEEFDITPSTLNLDNLKGVVVQLKPVKYSVSGRILSKQQKIPDLKLLAKSESRQVNLDLIPVPEGYSFNLMAFPGEEVIFMPQSADHLFDPESLHVFVDHDCHLEVAVFNANAGHFVKGQISPPVEGIKISITNADASLKHTETLTDKSGHYSLGPLPQGEYSVEATKDGYVFEKTSTGFKSKKLASILVKLMDTENNPLNTVVVSVSGGKYRSNTMSLDGSAEFLSLAPGEYFIKPQLKEYEFEPKHTLQKLNEGENAEVIMTAKRVAFSIFGKMVSLNGKPEPGITLRALSKDCNDLNEETISESDGTFRFRGLKPKCEYSITLLHGESIEKLIPKEVKVKMTEKDYTLEKSIVAMRAFETMDILLKVTEEGSTPSNLRISMVENNGGFTYNTKAVTGQLVTLPRVAKDKKKYNIHVETIPDKFAGQKKVSHTLVADEYVKSIRLVLNKTTTASKPAKKASSLIYILPLIVGALLAYIMWDQMPQFIKKFADVNASQRAASNFDNGSSKNAADDWDVTSTPSGTKRRSKKR